MASAYFEYFPNKTEIDQHKYSQLIFNKRIQAIEWRKESSINDAATTTGQPHDRISLYTDFIPFTKINLK